MVRLMHGAILIFAFFICLVFSVKQAIAADYFFDEEFNTERPVNTLDSGKWSVYPNAAPGVTTIQETGGNLNTTQNNFTNQYPFVVSKAPALPQGDFEAEIRFQYTHVTPFGSGFALSQTMPSIPTNDFGGLLALSVWQDNNIGLQMRLQYQSSVVYSVPINTNPHKFKVERTGLKYKLYLDDNLVYTSPDNPVQVRYVWFGNPTLQQGIPDWTKFNVDYVRVTSPAPKPFLDLPWDYEGKGLSFSEAANSITSFFDHKYPLLSSGLAEPQDGLNLTLGYDGQAPEGRNYSSHDGYDYGKLAKVNIGDPVLAAAAGTATYINTCGACGNMVVIDHGNGYQTRYLHLQKDGLITNIPGNKVSVSDRQQIGKVGATGNVSPSGDAGAHIHFGVFQDKNGDGNFDDNVPDGVTDPFGWQSRDPDPWPAYIFNYGGQVRTGNASFYLWKKKIDNLDATLTSNGGVFDVGRYNLNFPQGSTNQNLNITLHSSPITKPSNILQSIGGTLVAEATDTLGNLVNKFQSLFTLTINFSSFDLTSYNTDTISIYSSQDGTNWSKENTNVNLQTKIASAQLSHFTHFALMAERKDIVPPITTATLNGQQGQSNWFRSDAIVNLNAVDNDSGLGVDYTLYRFDGSDWDTYSNPLNFTSEGHHKVEFYTADKDENLEEIKSVEFDIDKTPPEGSIDANPKTLWPPDGRLVDIKVEGSSSDDHPYSTKFIVNDEYNQIKPVISGFGQTIQFEARRDGGDIDGRKYIIKAVIEDLAGNVTEKEIQVIVPHDQKLP